MDLDSLRNFGIIGSFLSAFFLVISIIAFSNGEIGGIAFLFGAVLFVLPLILYFINKRKAEKQKKAKDAMTRSMAQFEIIRIQMEIEKLNDDYCLGLYEGDIFAIAESPDPIKILQRAIEPGKPTVEECEENFKKTLHMLIHGIGLSEEEAEQIEGRMLPEIILDQETVDFFSKKCSKDLPPEMSFLNGKINYMIGVLGMLEEYAEIYDHELLRNKVQMISEKRGYTH